MLTGSTITGGSSISTDVFPALWLLSGGGGGGTALSLLIERNLLVFLGFGREGSGDADTELLLVVLGLPPPPLGPGSVTDLARSRFVCFWRNLGNLEGAWPGLGEDGDGEGVCREFLLDIKVIAAEEHNQSTWPTIVKLLYHLPTRQSK